MLTSLSIRNVVLIEAAELEFASGLSVLTGETGAGKSIVLGSLDLALGGRAERALVRNGAAQASVAATFEVADAHPARAVLAEAGIEAGEGEPVILRRTLAATGQSRAFINDAPVSVQLLHSVGESLVEIHGQHDDRGLLDPSGHRLLLDAFADLGAWRANLTNAHAAWRAAVEEREGHAERQSRLRAEADYLTHAAEELRALGAEPGEESRLADERALLAGAARIAADVEQAQEALGADFESRIGQAQRKLERMEGAARTLLEGATAALGRTLIEAREAQVQLDSALRALQHQPHRQSAIEERLHALRGAARKYRVTPDALSDKAAEIEAAVSALDRGSDEGAARERAVQSTFAAALTLAREISKRRAAAAEKLDAAVNRELEPLKLGKSVFSTRIDGLADQELGPAGLDRVTFEVATNPGTAPGALKAIASGGELARFILALKVVLARGSSATTLIFDEVDRGIGGAVADAVGERLARLAQGSQVLVVTHSPQVAARGDHHFVVAKRTIKGETRAAIEPLDQTMRAEEIARMLSGAEITEEARAAARKLLDAAAFPQEAPRKRRKAAP